MLSGLSLLFLAYFHESSAQTSLQPAIAQLPQCALNCLVTAASQLLCSLTNQTCICTNEPLQEAVTLCVTTSCTIKEALTTKNITSTACDAPVRDKRALYNALSTTFGTISGAAVVLRMCAKLIMISDQSCFWFDDLFIVITQFLEIACSVLNVHGLTANGLGKDIWTVKFKQITDFLHIFYIMEILYFAQVSLVKLSILLFYARIFSGTGVRRLMWGTIGFDVMFGTIFFFLAIFQCQPISFYWKQWDGEHSGKCFNIKAMAFANAGISIVLDIWMLGLALSQVLYLNLHWKKKLAVGFMFSVGTFVTVVSIVRLQALVTFANSVNPTWDNGSTANWSTIEINVGIICACMPSLRLLVVKLYPKILGTNNTSSNSFNKTYAKKEHRHTIVTVSAISNKNRLHPPSTHAIEHESSWDSDKRPLVELEEFGIDFLRLRACNDMWRDGHLRDSTSPKFGGSRLSSNFTATSWFL